MPDLAVQSPVDGQYGGGVLEAAEIAAGIISQEPGHPGTLEGLHRLLGHRRLLFGRVLQRMERQQREARRPVGEPGTLQRFEAFLDLGDARQEDEDAAALGDVLRPGDVTGGLSENCAEFAPELAPELAPRP